MCTWESVHWASPGWGDRTGAWRPPGAPSPLDGCTLGPEALHIWSGVSCHRGATSLLCELGFRCGPMGPHRCAGEVIGYPQPRPARAQEGKKGVTSAYSEVVVAPQKSQNGSRPLAVRPPCPWEPGG